MSSGCPTFWAEVEALDNRIEAGTQLSMLIDGRRLVERSTRWLVRSRPRGEIDVAQTIARFSAPARELAAALPAALQGHDREVYERRLEELSAAGVAPDLAHRVASMNPLLAVFDIVEDADACGCRTAAGDDDLLRDRLASRARLAARPDLRAAALGSVAGAGAGGAARRPLRAAPGPDARRAVRERRGGRGDGDGAIEEWLERNAAPVARAEEVLSDVRASESYDTTTLPVLLRELKNLV